MIGRQGEKLKNIELSTATKVRVGGERKREGRERGRGRERERERERDGKVITFPHTPDLYTSFGRPQ